MRKGIVAALILALLLAGCGGAAQPKQEEKAPAGQQSQTGGQSQAGGEPKQWSEPPAMQIDPEKQYIATMETSLGTLKIELYAKDSPMAVNNFIFLANEGFYEGVVFHRVIKGFMIQGGDPTGTGRGGPGYRFKDELPPKQPYTRGILAMANSGPNTNGSQFFICTGADCGGLDSAPNYVQFGKVIEGDEVLTKLESVEVTRGGEQVPSKPVNPPVIQKVTISEAK